MAVGHSSIVGNWVVTVGEVVSVDPEFWILADVSVAQGNSGGPAVNQDGEVIGVVSGRITSGDVSLTGVYDLKIILDLEDYAIPTLTTIEPGGFVAAMVQRHQ
jgi:S1-C subfamily serine protease